MLGGTLLAGSWITAGFKLSGDTPNYSVQDITDTVEGCLYQSGSFNTVIAYLQPEGIFNDAYLTVDAEPYHDFADIQDVGGFIQQVLGYCFPQLVIKQRDSVIVNFSPVSSGNNVSGNPVITQPGSKCPVGFYDNGWFSVNCVPLPVNQPNAPGQCDWNKLSFADYAACQLGVKPSQAVIAGVVVALVGVIAISKIAK
jgi:hypothetical protein